MILEFINQNKDIIEFVAAISGGIFAFIKWLDSRNRELKENDTRYIWTLSG